MQSTLDITQSSRNILYKFLEDNSLEQLNKIPDGFANNLIWNIGHIVVVQQMLVYKLSGLPMTISDEMVEKYRKGTKPESEVTQQEVDEMKQLLFTTLEQSKRDFENDIFKNYSEFTTMSGFAIRDAKEAMRFNTYHEALHTGIMMQIRKFL